jgi:putative ABC transport system substrate-binding protein
VSLETPADEAVRAGKKMTLDLRGLAAALLLLGTALAAEAQQASRVYRVGYLSEGRPADPASPLAAPWTAFVETLRELGYVEGRTLVIDRRFAEFKYDRLDELAAELVRLKPDVIVTGGTLNIAALKRATGVVPIVMTYAPDPVGDGLVASLQRPGGNVTGLSVTTGPEFIAKQLEILKEAVPRLSRVGVLRNAGRGGTETAAIEGAAAKLGMTVSFADVRVAADVEGAFAALGRRRAEALLILGGNVTWTTRRRIAELAIQHRLPGIHFFREYAEAGLLLAYGINFVAQHQRAATYVGKILAGAKPADLPVEEPTRFDLVVNLRTARALKLTIPAALLLRSDQVIE